MVFYRFLAGSRKKKSYTRIRNRPIDGRPIDGNPLKSISWDTIMTLVYTAQNLRVMDQPRRGESLWLRVSPPNQRRRYLTLFHPAKTSERRL